MASPVKKGWPLSTTWTICLAPFSHNFILTMSFSSLPPQLLPRLQCSKQAKLVFQRQNGLEILWCWHLLLRRFLNPTFSPFDASLGPDFFPFPLTGFTIIMQIAESFSSKHSFVIFFSEKTQWLVLHHILKHIWHFVRIRMVIIQSWKWNGKMRKCSIF